MVTRSLSWLDHYQWSIYWWICLQLFHFLLSTRSKLISILKLNCFMWKTDRKLEKHRFVSAFCYQPPKVLIYFINFTFIWSKVLIIKQVSLSNIHVIRNDDLRCVNTPPSSHINYLFVLTSVSMRDINIICRT